MVGHTQDEDDEVVAVHDVFLRQSTDTRYMLLQEPLRPKGNPYVRTKSCLLNAKLAVENDKKHPEMLEFSIRNDGHNPIKLRSYQCPARTNYAMGVMSEGALFLQPIESTHQLRPGFEHLDDQHMDEGLAEGLTRDKTENWIPLDCHKMLDKDAAKAVLAEVCTKEKKNQVNMIVPRGTYVRMAYYSERIDPMSLLSATGPEGLTRQQISSIASADLRTLAILKNALLTNYKTIFTAIRNQSYSKPQHDEFHKALEKYCWVVRGIFVLKSEWCTGYQIVDGREEDDYKIDAQTKLNIQKRVLIRDYVLTLFYKMNYIDRSKSFVENTEFCPPPAQIEELLHSMGKEVDFEAATGRPPVPGVDPEMGVWVLKVKPAGLLSKQVQLKAKCEAQFLKFVRATEKKLREEGGMTSAVLIEEEMRRFFSTTLSDMNPADMQTTPLMSLTRLREFLQLASKTNRHLSKLSETDKNEFIERFCARMTIVGVKEKLVYRKSLNNRDSDVFRNLLAKFLQDETCFKATDIIKRKTILSYCHQNGVAEPNEIIFRDVMSEFLNQNAKSSWVLRTDGLTT